MPSATKPSAYSSLWLLVSWMTVFLVGTDLFVISSFLPLIGEEVQVPPASLAILVSAFSLTYAVACPIQGRMAERWGLRTVLVSGVAALGLANLYTAMASSVLHLVISRVLAGVAAAAISPMVYALTAERAAPTQRTSRLALVNSGLVISLALGAPLGLLIGDMTDWRTVFVGLAVALWAMVPVNAAIWPAKTERRPATHAVTQERLWDAWPFLLCMVAWSAGVYATYTLLGAALNQDFNASAQDMALALTCFGFGATSGVILGGRLADRIGPSRLVQLSFASMLAAFTVCHFIYRQQLYGALVVNLFVIAFVAYGFFPAIQACAAQAFTTRRPTVLGLMSSALYVGMTLGATFGAGVFRMYGLEVVLLISATAATVGWGVSLQGAARKAGRVV